MFCPVVLAHFVDVDQLPAVRYFYAWVEISEDYVTVSNGVVVLLQTAFAVCQRFFANLAACEQCVSRIVRSSSCLGRQEFIY